MYKKTALLAPLLCMFTQCASTIAPWLELKPSYFFFYANPMNAVYNNGGFQVQGSASIPVWDYVALYGSVGYRKLWGHALNSGEKTVLNMLPVDIGLKPIFNVCDRLCYFFAIGPRYFHLHQRNSSSYIDCAINGSGIGLFVNTGFNVFLADHFLLGIFGEYSYERKKISPKKPNVFSNGSVQLGGLAFGLSLGYAF